MPSHWGNHSCYALIYSWKDDTYVSLTEASFFYQIRKLGENVPCFLFHTIFSKFYCWFLNVMEIIPYELFEVKWFLLKWYSFSCYIFFKFSLIFGVVCLSTVSLLSWSLLSFPPFLWSSVCSGMLGSSRVSSHSSFIVFLWDLRTGRLFVKSSILNGFLLNSYCRHNCQVDLGLEQIGGGTFSRERSSSFMHILYLLLHMLLH